MVKIGAINMVKIDIEQLTRSISYVIISEEDQTSRQFTQSNICSQCPHNINGECWGPSDHINKHKCLGDDE
jgi:hypothetical protein